MQKRWIGLLCALMMMLLCLPVLAEDAGEALTLEELEAWVESYKTRAMAAQPMNDPHEDAAHTEDGYAFIYDFATLYMDRPEMTEDSVVRNLVVTASEELGPRGTGIDMRPEQIIAAYYNENPLLEGDRGFAALYVSNMLPAGAQWAWVQRDGQRIMTIQYAIQEQAATGGDGYTDAGLIYTVQDDLVVAIRAYGLDSRIDLDSVQANVAAVQQVAEVSGYSQVPTSLVGTELEVFNREDLHFEGMDFLTLTPEQAEAALGACQSDSWMADDTGEFVRTMEFAACEITFIYDAQKLNPRPSALVIDMDSMEGPRRVRLGDTVASVFNRFRNGEGAFDGVSHEILYGTEGTGSWGTAEYGTDASCTLRYGFPTVDDQQVVLCLYFQQMYLSEMILYLD